MLYQRMGERSKYRKKDGKRGQRCTSKRRRSGFPFEQLFPTTRDYLIELFSFYRFHYENPTRFLIQYFCRQKYKIILLLLCLAELKKYCFFFAFEYFEATFFFRLIFPFSKTNRFASCSALFPIFHADRDVSVDRKWDDSPPGKPEVAASKVRDFLAFRPVDINCSPSIPNSCDSKWGMFPI